MSSVPSDMIDKVFCTSAVSLLASLPDACLDAVICDPPYGFGGKPKFESNRHKLDGGKFSAVRFTTDMLTQNPVGCIDQVGKLLHSRHLMMSVLRHGIDLPAFRVVNVAKERCDVYVGRGGGRTGHKKSHLGNRHVITKQRDRTQVIANYKTDLVNPEFIHMQTMLAGLRFYWLGHSEVRVGCHCAPLACHADFLCEMLRGRK